MHRYHLVSPDTTILHEGPLDAAEPNGPRGIVAVSFIGGLAGNFERREQLWMRARRTGAMQSEMGVYDYKTSLVLLVTATVAAFAEEVTQEVHQTGGNSRASPDKQATRSDSLLTFRNEDVEWDPITESPRVVRRPPFSSAQRAHGGAPCAGPWK